MLPFASDLRKTTYSIHCGIKTKEGSYFDFLSFNSCQSKLKGKFKPFFYLKYMG